MADIINAIALACGLTSELSKIYIDGVRDIVLGSLDGVNDRLDLMPTHEELQNMAQFALIGEGGANHTVVAEDFEANARYRIVTATNNPQIILGFYESHYGETWTETISLKGLEAQLGYYTFEILGLSQSGSTGGIRLLLQYEVNGEPNTITVNPPSGDYNNVELRTATFTGVESVYRYKPGMEVVIGASEAVIATLKAYVADMKADVVRELLDELQGLPVFGVVDANNIITVTSQLSGGTYTLKYENADGVLEDIGTIVVGGGNAPKYTNQIPISIDTDGKIYDGDGYAEGVRLSSSAVITSASGYCLTGFIPCVGGVDVVRMKNITVGTSSQYIALYDANFEFLPGAIRPISEVFTQGADGVYSGTIWHTGAKYFRISISGIDATSIITLNEEIV